MMSHEEFKMVVHEVQAMVENMKKKSFFFYDTIVENESMELK